MTRLSDCWKNTPMLTTTRLTSPLSLIARHLFIVIASLSLTFSGPPARAEEKKPEVKPPPVPASPAKEEPKAPSKEEPKAPPWVEPKAEPKVEPNVEPKPKNKNKQLKDKSKDKPDSAAKNEPPQPDPAKTDPAKPAPKPALPPLKPVPNAAWTKTAPENPADLKAIQDRVQEITKRAIPWTVGLRVGGASGSGVIISKEGYVLTAGHVSAAPNQRIDIILPDGKVLRGKSLGRNTGIDSGLVKIEDGDREWEHAEMAESAKVKQGDWCVAIGHPGGYMTGRPPVVRLGRVVSANDRTIWTDATLVGGDSGGPLFDMDGKVIAIHSRISAPTTANFHVPVDSYRNTWDRLAAAEDFTDRAINIGAAAGFYAQNVAENKGAKVTSVPERTPAFQAGLKQGDVITKFAGKDVKDCGVLFEILKKKQVADQIEVEVLREDKPVKLKISLAAGNMPGPFLGIQGDTNEKGGVLIDGIVAGTPAAEAQLRKDDIITKIGDKAVKTLDELQALISKRKPGETVTMEIIREGRPLGLRLHLGFRG